jgi:hypothetical protein
LEQKFADGNYGDIARPEMFFGSIDDRPHALRGARIVNQKMFSHSGKGLALLFLAILQVMVVDIANLYVSGTDVTFELFFPLGDSIRPPVLSSTV